jgi:hypothetical protein
MQVITARKLSSTPMPSEASRRSRTIKTQLDADAERSEQENADRRV